MEHVIYIRIDEVVRKFGYLIKGKGDLSGLEFAKEILKSKKDCVEYRETCASSVASTLYKINFSEAGTLRTEEYI